MSPQKKIAKRKAPVKARATGKSVPKAKTKAKIQTKAAPKAKAKTKTKAKTKAKAKATAISASTAARLIDERIRGLGDWRADTLSRMRGLILEADPTIVEEVKWRGVPVWSRSGIVCTGETYKSVVKLTFAYGASIADPKKLFNASLEGNMRRAIDIPKGGKVDATAFKALIKAAVARNVAKTSSKTR